MFDPKKLLDNLLGSSVPGAGGTVRERAGQAVQMARDNPLAASALAGVLLGTKGGRSVTESAVKLGGLAAIAGLAYHAYKNYQAGDAPRQQQPEPELLPPPSDSGFHPAEAPQGEAEFALALVRAMIAAAKADGHVDEEERRRIGDRLALARLDEEAEQFIMAELAAPLDIAAIAGAAATEEQKVELYTASRLTIDPDTRAERGYLDLLAGRLNLPDALVDHVEATVSAVKVPSAGSAPDAAPGNTSPGVNPRW